MWLDDCFENDYLNPDELGNIKWRCMILNFKGEPIKPLSWKIDALVKMMGYDLNAIKMELESD
jgi:hypothetical protein